jgi:hypothetical protein
MPKRLLVLVLCWFFWQSTVPAQAQFRAEVKLSLDRLSTKAVSDHLPSWQMINDQWGVVNGSQAEALYRYDVTTMDWQPLQGCHDFADLSEPRLSNAPCITKPGVILAIPGINHLAVQRLGKYTSILPEARPPKPGEVLITEVMWAGSYQGETSLASDEWVELYNTTEETIDLAGFNLIGAGLAGRTLTFPQQVYLPPRSYRVIGSKRGTQTQLAREPYFVFHYLSLSNTQAGIRLENTSGQLLDSLPSGVWKAGKNDLQAKQRFSAQRKQLDQPGDDWTNWTQCLAEICELSSSLQWKLQDPSRNFGTPWQSNVY